MVEEENVMIDDISAVVYELTTDDATSVTLPDVFMPSVESEAAAEEGRVSCIHCSSG
jgi:hypothetical protein